MKPLLISLLVCARAWCQPGVCYAGSTNQAANAGCPTDATQSPDIKAYIGSLNSAFTNMEMVLSGKPTPKILTALEMPPASASFRANDPVNCNLPVNTCVYSTAGPSTTSIGLSHYLDIAVTGAGANTLDDNYDPLYYSVAPEYTGTAVPGSVKWMQYQLSVDDQFFDHVRLTGTLLRLAAAPMTSTYKACGLNPATMTPAQASACLNPLFQATVAHLTTNGVPIFNFLTWHEPTGIFKNTTGQQFSESDWAQMVYSGCAAVHAAPGGAAILCGGGFASGEGSYITQYVNGATPDIGMVGLETYGGNDPSSYQNIMSTLAKQCAQAAAMGIRCDTTEGDPPRHVPSTSGTSGSEQYAYEGCAWETGSAGWQTYNVHAAWASTTSRYLAAFGFSSFTRFSSQAFAGYTADPAQNCFQASSATLQIMQQTAANSTTAAASYKTAVQWGGGPLSPATLVSASEQRHGVIIQ